MFAIVLMELATEEVERLGLDPERFRLFFEDSLPYVYGYFLHRVGGNVGVAEDLTQETFLALVSDLKRNRHADVSLKWLYGIARHKLLDHYRRKTRHERLFTDTDEDLGDVPFDASGDDARERAVAALALVPLAQRAALVLRYLDGFSVPEVAATLDKSIEAIESLLARGRVSFKRAYLEASW